MKILSIEVRDEKLLGSGVTLSEMIENQIDVKVIGVQFEGATETYQNFEYNDLVEDIGKELAEEYAALAGWNV